MKRFKFSLRRSNKQRTLIPKEIWMCIFKHLDSVKSTKEFGATCKSFQYIYQDRTCQAAWMNTRYGSRFSIYYALLILPERCDQDFLYTLFQQGSRLPTCLTQVLVQTYGKKRVGQGFESSVQRIPFSGYAYLISRSSPTDISGDACKDFFTLLTLNDPHYKAELDSGFFPLLTSNMRPLFKLAQIDPVRFKWITPLFDFDQEARAALWHAALAVLFDEAFRKSPVTEERRCLLHTVHNVMRRPMSGENDKDLFCKVFADFFTKYPRGYCDQHTMDRMLRLLHECIQPFSFSIIQAFKSLHVRSDIQERLDVFCATSIQK